ncbi:cell division protein ZapA [Azohydromonas caseinilytica]|uniref:Cell division protein ZapA n=1 Tax=Azohydromonas caseinilytica TaxID=2728836 RepID=A0A848F7B4_9BURK|nr:cell division protein ZapA [Azohydromonas caseinilytica]NML14636.1 cell division protein ZapA [Azohydromonas caseinilytica]
MKQLEVTILGQSYLLGCPDGGEQALQAAVAQVDREMTAIRDAGRIKARERIAVLAALNLAYQLVQRPAQAPSPAPAAPAGDSATAAQLQALIDRIDRALEADEAVSRTT